MLVVLEMAVFGVFLARRAIVYSHGRQPVENDRPKPQSPRRRRQARQEAGRRGRAHLAPQTLGLGLRTGENHTFLQSAINGVLRSHCPMVSWSYCRIRGGKAFYYNSLPLLGHY